MISVEDKCKLIATFEKDQISNTQRTFASISSELVLLSTYSFTSEDDSIQSKIKQCQIYNVVKDENISKFHSIIESNYCNYVTAISYPQGGILDEFLRNRQNVDLNFNLKLATEIAKAICHLHSLSIIHNDLRPYKIGLDSNYHCQLLELESAAIVTDIFTPQFLNVINDRTYLAPEVLQGTVGYSGASDVFSFGIILIQLFLNIPNSSDIPRNDLGEIINNNNDNDNDSSDDVSYSYFNSDNNPLLPPSLLELMRQTVLTAPELRPSMEDAKEWLSSILEQNPVTAAQKAYQHQHHVSPLKRSTSSSAIKSPSPSPSPALSTVTGFNNINNNNNNNNNTPVSVDVDVDGSIDGTTTPTTNRTTSSDTASTTAAAAAAGVVKASSLFSHRRYFFIRGLHLGWAITEEAYHLGETQEVDLTACTLVEDEHAMTCSFIVVYVKKSSDRLKHTRRKLSWTDVKTGDGDGDGDGKHSQRPRHELRLSADSPALTF
eukprot:gene11472-23992_t